jgi:DNA invertase Pin-like site-specific DNA recombinase
MRERLAGLGFAEVEVIDEDLGCSAASGTLRAGFARMVAEVCLGKVGAVAAREVSRFARCLDVRRHSGGVATAGIPPQYELYGRWGPS